MDTGIRIWERYGLAGSKHYDELLKEMTAERAAEVARRLQEQKAPPKGKKENQ